MTVRGARDVGWDEGARLRFASGDERHGVVLDVDDDRAVVQVYEGTAGVRPAETSVAFAGGPTCVKVSEALARTDVERSGRADRRRPARARRARARGHRLPVQPDGPPAPRPIRCSPGIAAIDVMTTLVRGQKLPVFSVGGLPHLELAAQIAAQANVGGEAFCVVFAAMGVTHADASMVRDVLEARAAAGDLALFVNTADDPIVERLLTPRIALDGRRAPRVRSRLSRARRDGRHDELLRSAARGRRGRGASCPLAAAIPAISTATSRRSTNGAAGCATGRVRSRRSRC